MLTVCVAVVNKSAVSRRFRTTSDVAIRQMQTRHLAPCRIQRHPVLYCSSTLFQVQNDLVCLHVRSFLPSEFFTCFSTTTLILLVFRVDAIATAGVTPKCWRAFRGSFRGERVGTLFPLLKCLRTHYGRHCEPFSSQKRTRLQNVAYEISFSLAPPPAPTPSRRGGGGSSRCLDPDINFRLTRQRSHCSRFTKRPLVHACTCSSGWCHKISACLCHISVD